MALVSIKSYQFPSVVVFTKPWNKDNPWTTFKGAVWINYVGMKTEGETEEDREETGRRRRQIGGGRESDRKMTKEWTGKRWLMRYGRMARLRDYDQSERDGAVQMSVPHFTCGCGWPSTSLPPSTHPSIPCFSPLCQDVSRVSQCGVRPSHEPVFSFLLLLLILSSPKHPLYCLIMTVSGLLLPFINSKL